jgi:hypothetical protein
MAFFLLGDPDPSPEPEICASQAADRDGEALLERVYVISRDPGCGTLLLYSPQIRASRIQIMFLTCGAKGTRTPDPLLANNRQHVHPRPYPQVTVPESVSASLQIRTCCGTSVLYSPPWPTAARTPRAIPVHSPRKPCRATTGTELIPATTTVTA